MRLMALALKPASVRQARMGAVLERLAQSGRAAFCLPPNCQSGTCFARLASAPVDVPSGLEVSETAFEVA